MTQHAFQLRFRAEHEDEGKGSLFFDCRLPDHAMTHAVRRIVARVAHDHPQAQFDGMLYHAPKILENA